MRMNQMNTDYHNNRIRSGKNRVTNQDSTASDQAKIDNNIISEQQIKIQQSRLIDPPEVEIEVPLSGPANILARGEIEEEDDSLYEEDNPDDFKREKLDVLTLIQWISLISILSALILILSVLVVKGLHIWEWEVLVLVLICGRLVSGWWCADEDDEEEESLRPGGMVFTVRSVSQGGIVAMHEIPCHGGVDHGSEPEA
ncbi:hypothetical protein L1987_57699 [Smallanthus sonchifolius]|uniref:Uncharacterized protein n=1 Tax=Smallanthus sonchifolius TaxID=185202 RepID=A0ACB9DDR1_9ASTR|nr:hypothetical protein L1987_57699 [Smallanthus sonchifolius]